MAIRTAFAGCRPEFRGLIDIHDFGLQYHDIVSAGNRLSAGENCVRPAYFLIIYNSPLSFHTPVVLYQTEVEAVALQERMNRPTLKLHSSVE